MENSKQAETGTEDELSFADAGECFLPTAPLTDGELELIETIAALESPPRFEIHDSAAGKLLRVRGD